MKKKHSPVLIALIGIISVAAIGFGAHKIQQHIPTKEKMNPTEYFGNVENNQAVIQINTKILEDRGVVENNKLYIPLKVVSNYINNSFYYDKDKDLVLITTPNEIIENKIIADKASPVFSIGDRVYVSLDLVKKYSDINDFFNENPNRITIETKFNNVQVVQVKKDSPVRYRGGIKSPILTEVESGTDLRLIKELDDWDEVATNNGFIGYISKSNVSNPEIKDYKRDFKPLEYNYITMDKPVNLLWHQVTSQASNAQIDNDLQGVTGVNVISPTWFSISDNSGNLSDLTSKEYVDKVHGKGMKIWPLVDNFSPDIDITTVLSSSNSRRNIINKLINQAKDNNFDGLNIDFETLPESAGIHFLQFLRELSIETHRNNLVLSVDNPVPADFTSHYNRKEQGRVVDYVVIMGYDEHYVGSEKAGSVASLPWVEQGIVDTLKEVPSERIINGIPFYSRLWKDNQGAISSEAYGMDKVQEIIKTNNVETYWDNKAGQDFGTFDEGAVTYKIWIENDKSISEKVKLIKKYKLAGVAEWKLGLNNNSVWNVISENLK